MTTVATCCGLNNCSIKLWKLKIFILVPHQVFLENPEAISDIFTLPQDFGPFSLRLRQQASRFVLCCPDVVTQCSASPTLASRQKNRSHQVYFLFHVKLEHNFSSFISFVATWFKSLDAFINIQSYCPSFGWSPSGPFNPKMNLIT